VAVEERLEQPPLMVEPVAQA
jgi:hypothetical protein